MPYKGGVQLLPETQRRPTLRSYTSGNSYFYFALMLGAVILVVGATLGGYKRNLVDQINTIDGQIRTSETARNKDAERELIAAAKQSRIMQQLLSSKLYWSQALEAIEGMMQTSVTFDSIEGDTQKGAISYAAVTNSYASVARQLAAFVAATGVKDITVGEIESTAEGTVEFSGEIFIDTKALLMKSTASPTPSPSVSPTTPQP